MYYLKIKVITDARSEKVEKISDEEWKLWTKKPAENNQANERIMELVREEYPDEPVQMIKGHRTPSKIVSIG